MTAPLAGILVADFSRVLAGPLATATLADLGADVIKVERPGSGDDTRAWGPPWTTNTSSYFEAPNRSKRSITLDLEDPDDLAVAWRLAERADIVVENFKTGTLARHGLGFVDVAARNPGVVYCSITGFGSGAGADLAGYDFLIQAVGGLMSITGEPDGAPMKVGVALVDVLTAKDATTAILAALRHRDATGQGQHVEVNLLSSLLGSLVNQASTYLSTGREPSRMGNAHPSIAPYELLATADAPLALACGNDAQFVRLVGVLGRADLATDPRFSTNPARVEHRPALVVELERALAQATSAQWVERLGAVGIPAGRVASIGEAFALARDLGLEPTVEVGDGRPAQVRHPATYSATPVERYVAPPTLGQHSDEIRRWLTEETA
ncbi:CoA transferase [Nocardioides sp.]|uniref:CaiB/BaiF CoA transferase family protein n=1 Tax=Nocardioides sp. TaxID=35761 RepID=UPI0026300AEF|nr:CoA transferase [Nocardioides sp.]